MAEENDFLGVDWAVEGDLEERVRLVGGRENLALAIMRRLGTPRGGLFYDPDYGLDLRAWLSADFDAVTIQNMGPQIEDEVLKDERVQGADATITYDLATEVLLVELEIVDEQGPFELVLSVNEVNVSILRGGSVRTTAAPVTAAVATAPLVPAASGVGQRGPSGPAGASASSSFEVSLDDDGEHYVIGVSERVVGNGWLVNFAGAPADLVVALAAAAMVSAGAGVLRVRVGGTENGIDGTLVASVNVTATSFTATVASGTLPNPGGQAWVKVTAVAAGASEAIYVRRPAVTLKE